MKRFLSKSPAVAAITLLMTWAVALSVPPTPLFNDVSPTDVSARAKETSGTPPSILISAAASLAQPLLKLKAMYEADHPEIWLLNFASSGTLRVQIEQGAPVELFISAAIPHVERLTKQGSAEPTSAASIASNHLVVVRPKGNSWPRSWGDLAHADARRISIGDPSHVPVGWYARKALQTAGMWEAIHSSLVLGTDARQVILYVERGAVDAAVVYASDLRQSETAQSAGIVPQDAYPPVQYTMITLKRSRSKAEAASLEAVRAFLRSEEAQAVFSTYGFGGIP